MHFDLLPRNTAWMEGLSVRALLDLGVVFVTIFSIIRTFFAEVCGRVSFTLLEALDSLLLRLYPSVFVKGD